MKFKLWHWTWLPVTIFGTLAIISLLYIGLKDPNVGKVDTSQQLRYVLVNQDEGASFNQTDYKLGNDFVNLINQDKTNQWQTASADIAEAGFAKGNYDAIITIRPDFSRKLLSLQAASPEKADISYQVRPDQNRISATQLASQVNEMMFTFNKKVVGMYFSSVLDNLLNAQQNATNIVNGDGVNLTTLNQQIKTPLTPTADGFTRALNSDNAMLQQTDSWEQQQANFTKLTTDLLHSNAKQVQQNALTLSDYIAFQEKISKLNYANVKADMKQQAKNDEKGYQSQFDALNKTMSAQMQGLGGKRGTTALLGQLHQLGESFAKKQNQIQDSIKDQLAQAASTQQALTAQRRAIIEQYTGDPDFDVKKSSKEALNLALATTLSKKMTLAKDNFPASYFDTVKHDLQTIPVPALKRLLTQFKNQHLLDDATYHDYMNQITIVQKEAADQKIDLKDQNLIGDQTKATGETHYESNLKVTLTDAANGKITFNSLKHGTAIKLTNAQALLDQVNQVIVAKKLNLTAKLDAHQAIILTVKKPSKTATSTPATKEQMSTAVDPAAGSVNTAVSDAASPNDATSKQIPSGFSSSSSSSSSYNSSSSSSKTSSSSSQAKPAKQAEVTLHPEMTWQEDLNSATPYKSINCLFAYSTGDNKVAQTYQLTLTKYIADLPANKLPDFMKMILGQTTQLTQTASTIAAAYAPTKGKDASKIDWLATTISKENKTMPLEALADTSSLYKRFSREALLTLTQKALLASLRQEMNHLLENNQALTDRLTETIGSDDQPNSLKWMLANLPASDQINNQYDKLFSWFNRAQKSVNAAYESWRVEPIKEIHQRQAGNKNDNESIYFDTSKGTSLKQQFQSFAHEATQTATSITDSAAKISSLHGQINEIATQLKTLQTATNKASTSTNQLAKTADKQLTDNTGYVKRFSQVFSNAHNGQTSNPKVFDFLSSPLRVVNNSTNDHGNSLIAYILTIITALLMLLIAWLFSWNSKRHKANINALALKENFITANLKSTAILMIISILAAAGFAFISRKNLPTTNLTAWWLFTGLILIGGIMGFGYLFRQASPLGLIVWTILFGLYLILTPTIGVSVQQGSFIGEVFRLSPFQIVENGFSSLLGGATLSFNTALLLAVASGAVIILNLFVYYRKGDGSDDAINEANQSTDD